MDNTVFLIILYSFLLVILLLLSFFFSSADMAYGSVSSERLSRISAKNPTKQNFRVEKLTKNYDKTISTILLFNNLVNSGLDSISTLLGITIAVGVLNIPGDVEIWGLIASLIILLFKIIFGEVLAKSVGKIYNYKLASLYSYIINIATYILYPFIFLVGGFCYFVSLPITKTLKDIDTTQEELHEIIDEFVEEGQMDEDKADLLRGTIDYATTETYEIMTPRSRVYAIDKDRDIDDILSDERTFKHSRIPVYEENIDNVIGYVKSKDLIRIKLENKLNDISSIIHPIVFFPRTTEINDVLIHFKKEKEQIAMVLDEYGGVEGLISLEDILEEIVGEIWDETDNTNNPVSERSDGSYIIDGGMNLEDFCDLFELDYESIETEYVTIGGFIIELKDDKFANIGDIIKYKNIEMKVIALGKHHTVKKIEVNKLNEEDE